MNYEEKYNEALERAKKLHDSYNLMHISVDEIEQIFPELAESEDERIRKQLIDAIKIGRSNSGISFTEEAASRYIAWLEKHSEEEIRKIRKEEYTNGFNDAAGFEEQKEQKPLETPSPSVIYTEQGDVLAEQKPVENEKVEITDFEQSVYDLCPVLGIEEAKATASDLLELAKKTLLKTGKVVLASNYPEGCSFEDGFHLGYNEGFNAKQKEQKPAEWSEEDEKTINDACCWIAEYAGYLMDKNYGKASMLMCLTDKLKALRPSLKPSDVCYGPKGDPDPAGVWKPSEEQMKALLNAEGFLRAGLQHDSAKTIAELYEHLKKL